jgi:CHASE3 domain sensor protein
MIRSDMAARNIRGTKDEQETFDIPASDVQAASNGHIQEVKNNATRGSEEVQMTAEIPPREARKTRRRGTLKEAVKIRLDTGEYAALQEIADDQGTMASVLIRQAVKQIIKTYRAR